MSKPNKRPTPAAAKSKAPPKPATKPPRNKGRTEYGLRLDPSTRAMIWTLTEEGKSQRAVAEELGIAPSSVTKELGSDPVALDTLRARQREARARLWQEMETAGLEEAIAWLRKLKSVRIADGKGKEKPLSIRAERMLTLIPRAIDVTKRAAESATKMTQLLTGGATERIDNTSSQIDEMNAEQLIEAAIQTGCVDQLPPAMRAAAKARQEKAG